MEATKEKIQRQFPFIEVKDGMTTNLIPDLRQIQTLEKEVDKFDDFKKRVKKMRRAQTQYFRHRRKEDMAEAKRLEKEVDLDLSDQRQLF